MGSFDINGNQWNVNATMLPYKIEFTCLTMNEDDVNKPIIYIVGGGSLSSVLSYLPLTDSFENVVPNMNGNRRLHSCQYINNKLYAFGGETSDADVTLYNFNQPNWISLNGSLSECKLNLKSTVHKEKELIIITGGQGSIDPYSNSVDVIDINSDTIYIISPINIGRYWHLTFYDPITTIIYVIGGKDTDTTYTNTIEELFIQSFQVISNISYISSLQFSGKNRNNGNFILFGGNPIKSNEYNPKLNMFSDIAIPFNMTSLFTFGDTYETIRDQNIIYFMYFQDFTSLNRYDISNNVIDFNVATLPEIRSLPCLTINQDNVTDVRIYIIGGRLDPQNGDSLDTVMIYYVSTDTFSLTDLPRMIGYPRSQHSCQYSLNKIFVFGGWETDDVLALRIGEQSWKVLNDTLSQNRRRDLISIIDETDNWIYIIGGHGTLIEFSNAVDVLNPTLETIKPGPSLNIGRYRHTAVYDCNSEAIYVFGGVIDSSFIPTGIVEKLQVRPPKPPTRTPTDTPSISPSITPTIKTIIPSISPVPSVSQTTRPTISPTIIPTFTPSNTPTIPPSMLPSISPALNPSDMPSISPSISPSITPTQSTLIPTNNPTNTPSFTPSLSPLSQCVSEGQLIISPSQRCVCCFENLKLRQRCYVSNVADPALDNCTVTDIKTSNSKDVFIFLNMTTQYAYGMRIHYIN